MPNTPVPTVLKKMKGSHRKSRDNGKEPEAIEPDGTAPEWMDDKTKAFYRMMAQDLRDMRVLSQSDSLALSILCESWMEYQESCQQRDKALADGEMNAYCALLGKIDSQRGRMVSLMREFGLTPSARSRIQVTEQPAKEDNPWLEHARRNRTPCRS